MRSRIIQQPFTIPSGHFEQDQYELSTGNFIRTAGQTDSPPTACGYSVDDIIIDEQPQMKRYGNCTHTMTRTKRYENTPSISWNWSPDRFVDKYSGGYWLYSVRALIDSWITPTVTVRTVDWSDMSYEALSVMRPQFSDASLLNDLLELRQVADLINPLGVRKGWLKRYRKGKAPITRLDEFKAGASMHLWYQFGIKPAIASAKEVYRLIKELPLVIAKLRQETGKLRVRHFSRAMDFIDLPPQNATVYNGGGYVIKQTTSWIVPPVYHASMRFRYDVSRLSDLELMTRAWAQALGLDKPLRVAWNSIPLSFVVDWFADIGRWLGSLTDGSVIPIVVEDFCASTKFRYITSAVGDFTVGVVNPKTVTTLQIGSRTHGVYDRRVGPPSTTSRVRFGLPSIDQVFTLVSLAVQRIPTRKPLRQPPKPRWLAFSSKGVFSRRAVIAK